jgi:hypothetical protein
MTFTVGSTIEQRYPGATPDLARASARERVAAFKEAGWELREERWVPDGIATPEDRAGPGYTLPVTPPGALVVVFVAAREASLPPTLRAQPIETASGPRMSGYMLRLVVGLVVFLIVLAVLFSVGLPIVGTLVGGGTPKPFTGG